MSKTTNFNMFAALDDDSDDDNTHLNTSAKNSKRRSKSPSKTTVKKANAKVLKNNSSDSKVTAMPKTNNNASGKGPSKRGGGGAAGGKNRHSGYDRKSGTGHGKEGVKHGGGAHNWGNESSEAALAAEVDLAKDVTEETTTDGEVAVAEEEEEEEVITMSLEEYREMQKNEQPCNENFAQTTVRQVKNEFGSQVSLTKDGKTPDFIENKVEKVHRERSTGRKQTVFKDVGFRAPPVETFREGGRGEGGRGGRGGAGRGRGGAGRGRGGGRGGAGYQSRNASSRAPNVSDMSSFPTLG